MKKWLYLLCVLPLLLCSGCRDQHIFEETSIIIYAGIEEGSGGERLAFTLATAGEKDGKGKLELMNAGGDLLSTAIEDADRRSPKPLGDAKIQNVLVSETLCRQGLLELTDINKLNAVNRFLPDYVVVEGKPSKLLEAIAGLDLGDAAFSYLGDMLDNCARSGICPDHAKKEMTLELMNGLVDPMLPVVSLDKDKPQVTGTALFIGDRLVAKLPAERSRLLHFMACSPEEAVISMPFQFKDSKEQAISYYVTRSNQKLKVQCDGSTASAAIAVDLTGYIDELNYEQMRKQFTVEEFSAALTEYLQKEMQTTLQMVQATGSDPFGVRENLRAFHGGMDGRDLRAVYRAMPLTVDVTVHLTNEANKW